MKREVLVVILPEDAYIRSVQVRWSDGTWSEISVGEDATRDVGVAVRLATPADCARELGITSDDLFWAAKWADVHADTRGHVKFAIAAHLVREAEVSETASEEGKVEL